MDNDNFLKKFLANTYRKVRLHIDYDSLGLLNSSKGNTLIGDFIKSGSPFVAGRLGSGEMRCVIKWMYGKEAPEDARENILFFSGVFPNTQEVIDGFSRIYTEAVSTCDIIAVCEVVGEKKAISTYCPNATVVKARALEPYYFAEPWSANLRDKKVLIINPFVDSIKSQLSRRDKIWKNKSILPNFKDVSFLKAVQSSAGAKTDFENWFEALEFMKKEIDKIDFDVALIGAGAYSLPLAAYCKSIGKQAIQTAGGTQILFGIKGKRWDNHPIISKFYNEFWIRPSGSEIPPHPEKVEGGSYW